MMQDNQLIITTDTIQNVTLPIQPALQKESWFTSERIANDYIHAYQSSTSRHHLNSDADSIQIFTQADSLTRQLINNIHRHIPPATTHTEMPATLRTTPYIQQQKEWIFSIVFFVFILIASVRVSAPQFITELFQSVFSSTKWKKITDAIKLQNKRTTLLLFTIYHIITPLLIYEFLISQQFSLFNLQDIRLYLIIFAGWLVLFAIRTAGFQFLGYIFDTKQQTSSYAQVSLIFTNITGLVLIPFALLIPFIEPAHYQLLFQVVIILFILLYIWHLTKGIKIILDDFLSLFYMFLYLCALEIAPLLWLYKLAIG